jgi:hypothetical protein
MERFNYVAPVDALTWLVGALLIVIFAYAVVRSMSFAYFRSRLEHLRAVMKEMRKGETDGI